MTRSIPIYLIAIWSFISLSVLTTQLGRAATSIIFGDNPAAEHRQLIPGLLGIFLIWHIIQLIRLKSFSRKLIIWLFSICISLICAIALITIFSSGPTRATSVGIVFIILNSLSIFYLCRPHIKELFLAAERARNEKAMRKASLKKLQ